MEVGATVVGGGGTAVFIDLVFAEELVPVVKVHMEKEVGRRNEDFWSTVPSRFSFFL